MIFVSCFLFSFHLSLIHEPNFIGALQLSTLDSTSQQWQLLLRKISFRKYPPLQFPNSFLAMMRLLCLFWFFLLQSTLLQAFIFSHCLQTIHLFSRLTNVDQPRTMVLLSVLTNDNHNVPKCSCTRNSMLAPCNDLVHVQPKIIRISPSSKNVCSAGQPFSPLYSPYFEPTQSLYIHRSSTADLRHQCCIIPNFSVWDSWSLKQLVARLELFYTIQYMNHIDCKVHENTE